MVAQVVVNDKKVGDIDNVYRTYYIKLDNIKEGTNSLSIQIESTVRYTYIKAAEYDMKKFNES